MNPCIIIETKADKIPKAKWQKHIKITKETLELDPNDHIILFSSETGDGKEKAWSVLQSYMDKIKSGNITFPLFCMNLKSDQISVLFRIMSVKNDRISVSSRYPLLLLYIRNRHFLENMRLSSFEK